MNLKYVIVGCLSTMLIFSEGRDLIYAHSVELHQVKKADQEVSSLQASTSSIFVDVLYDKAQDDVISGHLAKDDEFENEDDLKRYLADYDQLELIYKKGLSEGKHNGNNQIKSDNTKKDVVWQAGYQEGYQEATDIYDLQHKEIITSSSSASNQDGSTVKSSAATQSSLANQTRVCGTEVSEAGEAITEQENKLPFISPADLNLSIGPEIKSHREFIQLITKSAVKIAQQNDLFPSVMIAQACLESSWGTSDLSRSPIFNLFGVKGGYKGMSVSMETQEDDGSGNLTQINADFRRYRSYYESLNDYATLFQQPMFRAVKQDVCADYREATAKLTGTYATDVQYNLKLNQIIETYHLEKLDNKTAPRNVKKIKVNECKIVFDKPRHKKDSYQLDKSEKKRKIAFNVIPQILMVGPLLLKILRK